MKKKDWRRIAIAYGEVNDRRLIDIQNLRIYQDNMIEEHIRELAGKRAMSELLKETIPRWIDEYSAKQMDLLSEIWTPHASFDVPKIRGIMADLNQKIHELRELCSDVLKSTGE